MNAILSRSPNSFATIRERNAFRFLLAAIIAAVCFVPNVVWATGTLSVGSDIEFSNGQAPASATTPWLLMTITDDVPDSVIFKLTASNLTGSENVELFDFNLDPALAADLGHLTFTNLVTTGTFTVPSVSLGTISQGADAFKADGDGKYDIKLQFATGTNNTFTNGDSLQYTITGAGISAASFDFKSAPAGGSGPFTTAAHIQNTTGAGHGGSGWVADSTGGSFHLTQVPEPSSIVLAVIAVAASIGIWRRRKPR